MSANQKYTVEVKAIAGWTTHSTHASFQDAADQADMVHGRVVGEEQAFAWAKSNQGFTGDFGQWMAQDDDERSEYEDGAAGIPTA
jgi:hypothetical protein